MLIHFISKRHHIYKDKTNDNRFYYLMDHSLTDPLNTNFELLPENNLHKGQTLALDIVLDTDHIDCSALGNIDPDLNILLDNNTMNCKYFTEIEFNNYFTTPDNFSLFTLNIRAYLKMLSIYNIF